ncbi:MAG: zinc ribbon domain-containing protein [Clostridia bacterium]|nr:zinc ribbon domain-containing protein [Clostridia bacterium]
MKRNLRKILIAVITVICALSVQVSVSALPDIDLGDMNVEDILDLLGQLTATNPDNTTTTTTEAETTTQSRGEDVSNPVNTSGSGSVTTTQTETTTGKDYENNTYYPTYNNNGNSNNNQLTTTEPSGDESTTLSFEASLSDIFEDDSAAVILQPSNETFTIGNLVVNDGNDSDGEFTWQMGALIAAAVLFVVLLALIVALIMQNSKKKKKHRYHDSYPKGDSSYAPVPVEIMTPERIAELLGSTSGRNISNNSYETMSSDETAAAIKAAVLMGQLSPSYSDPILRKYTDEPVMISPNSSPLEDIDSASVADILKATDYIMDDIENEEMSVEGDSQETDSQQNENAVNNRICPDCGNDIPVDDVFCHNCGTYIG